MWALAPEYPATKRARAETRALTVRDSLFSCLRRSRLVSHQLVGQRARAVDLSQRFLNAARIHRNRASLHVAECEIPGQRFDVAVENDSHHLSLLVHRRRSRIASNDVRRRNEIQRRLSV